MERLIEIAGMGNHSVMRVDRVADKLRQSLPLLQAEQKAGRRVLVLLPKENVVDVPANLSAAIAGIDAGPHAISSLQEVPRIVRGAVAIWPDHRLRRAASIGSVAVMLPVGWWLLTQQPDIPLPRRAEKGSFNCSEYYARHPFKTSPGRYPQSDLICNDLEAADLDKRLGHVYRELVDAMRDRGLDHTAFRTAHQNWWKSERPIACKSNWETILTKRDEQLFCIKKEIQTRTRDYELRLRRLKEATP